MPAYKTKENGTWLVLTYYQNYKGERIRKAKRGFATKRAALEWEREFLQKSAADLSMTFASFVEVYTKDMCPRIREHAWRTNENIIQTKLIPYFDKKKLNGILAKRCVRKCEYSSHLTLAITSESTIMAIRILAIVYMNLSKTILDS